ncbi:MAG: SDR family NAD(P)-dependent oxidoreductase [Christensenellales bacterium]
MSYKNLFDLTGKNALVTGGASGLGEGISHGFAEFGANIAIVDMNLEGAQKVANDLHSQYGVKAVAVQCNITDPADVKAAVAKVVEAFGEINILMNTAGIARRCPAEDMPDDYFDAVMKVNMYGTFYVSREVGKVMIAQGKGGRIINMASISGVSALPRESGGSNYCASKSAVIGYTKSLCVEWAPFNILVNAICPTHIRTPLIQKVMDEKPEMEKYYCSNVRTGRIGEIREVVGAAIYFASEASSLVSGTSMIIDAGTIAGQRI